MALGGCLATLTISEPSDPAAGVYGNSTHWRIRCVEVFAAPFAPGAYRRLLVRYWGTAALAAGGEQLLPGTAGGGRGFSIKIYDGCTVNVELFRSPTLGTGPGGLSTNRNTAAKVGNISAPDASYDLIIPGFQWEFTWSLILVMGRVITAGKLGPWHCVSSVNVCNEWPTVTST